MARVQRLTRELTNEVTPNVRPPQVYKKADEAWNSAFKSSLEKSGSYVTAARAALKAYDGVIKNYDRTHESTVKSSA